MARPEESQTSTSHAESYNADNGGANHPDSVVVPLANVRPAARKTVARPRETVTEKKETMSERAASVNTGAGAGHAAAT